MPARHNLELKARDRTPPRSLAVCRALGAEDHGVITQRDTYFRVVQGRLKLREEDPGEPHLIHYHRPDMAGERDSTYRIAPVDDAAATRALLADALGVRAEVTKQRRLLVWQGVRVHLDAVHGHGDFVELEAVQLPDAVARDRLRELRVALAIADEDLLAGGYLDL